MTIHEIASQLIQTSVAGYINGEKFTVARLENQIKAQMRVTNRLVYEISLLDGRWYFKIVRYGTGTDDYDYIIPDTREQESRLKAEFHASISS